MALSFPLSISPELPACLTYLSFFSKMDGWMDGLNYPKHIILINNTSYGRDEIKSHQGLLHSGYYSRYIYALFNLHGYFKESYLDI